MKPNGSSWRPVASFICGLSISLPWSSLTFSTAISPFSLRSHLTFTASPVMRSLVSVSSLYSTFLDKSGATTSGFTGPPRYQSVMPHQIKITTAITVVAYMILMPCRSTQVNADLVLPKKVKGCNDGDKDRSPAAKIVGSVGGTENVGVHHLRGRNEQTHDVLSGRNGTDRTGEDIVEHQGRNRKFGQKPAHRFFHNAIHAATHKERTAFDINQRNGAAEEHDDEDEHGRRRTDGAFDDAANVIGRAGEVAKHDRGRSPVRYEGEHHAAYDYHLGSGVAARRPDGRGAGFYNDASDICRLIPIFARTFARGEGFSRVQSLKASFKSRSEIKLDCWESY